MPIPRTGGTIAAVCSKSPHIPWNHRIENVPRLHPYPDRPVAGLHVRTRAAATSGRQRRSEAGSGNCATAHQDANGGNAAAPDCPNGYTRTDGYGSPRADPDNRTIANCHDIPANGDRGTHGNGYCLATYAHADAHLTACPTDGYGNNHDAHNGVTRHGVGHPLEPPRLRPPRLEALDRRRRRLSGRPPRGPDGRKPD